MLSTDILRTLIVMPSWQNYCSRQRPNSSKQEVSYGSIKRFETTGQISLVSLTKLAMALDIAGDLRNAFTQIPYQDIQEVINENK